MTPRTAPEAQPVPGVSLAGYKTRTMWDAARDMFAEAHRLRDEEMWDRAYRLWCQACFANAPGVPYMLTSYRPLWLPTRVVPAPCTCGLCLA
jgi:hypothetical protein